MTRSSRYVRPEQPPRGLVIQARDLEVLESVGHYGYLTSEHLRQLLFPGVSLRVAQGRLRLLWEHGLLERSFLPIVLTSTPGTRSPTARPLYSLSHQGGAILEESGRGPRANKGPTSQPTSVEHDLVATEFLVSLEIACREREDVVLVSTMPESHLRRELARRRAELPSGPSFVVPDGAFTLRAGAESSDLTFYVEVVRADVRGGNQRLKAKLERYLRLLRANFFKAAYDHEQVRAVLVVTTSPARARNLQELAATLPHGHRFFWFGSWQAENGPAFDPTTVLVRPWTSAAGETLSLLQALTVGRSTPIPHPHAPSRTTSDERTSPPHRGDDVPPPVPPLRPSARGPAPAPVPPREDGVR